MCQKRSEKLKGGMGAESKKASGDNQIQPPTNRQLRGEMNGLIIFIDYVWDVTVWRSLWTELFVAV